MDFTGTKQYRQRDWQLLRAVDSAVAQLAGGTWALGCCIRVLLAQGQKKKRFIGSVWEGHLYSLRTGAQLSPILNMASG